MKKNHCGDVHALLGAIATTPSSFPAGRKEQQERLLVIQALADYACISRGFAATVVDSIATGEAFAVSNDTAKWREVTAQTATNEAHK